MTELFDDPGRTIVVDRQTKPAPEIQLGQLAIPGSHDSTADDMGGFADECQSAGFFQKTFGEGLTRRWARTQHHDLYTQARLGIRSFDIRPYYNGSELRTCHTLDAGSFRSAFEGDGGLKRFFSENPKEVAIVNISHFRPRRDGNDAKFDRGIDAMANYLRENVCPQAIDPSVAPQPGRITLAQMWAEKKNFVLVADNEEDFYGRLRAKLGVGKCIYNSDEISGGYAGEEDRVPIGDGRSSSTNLWNGILGKLTCNRKGVYCGGGGETPDTVRRATEKILLDKFKAGHKSLHETSYIWVYGTFAGLGNSQVLLFKKEAGDCTLLDATDHRQVLLDDGWFYNTYIDGGLKPFAESFVNRLRDEANLRQTGVGVGVVNMDGIGYGDTFNEFVSPMLVIDRQILTR